MSHPSTDSAYGIWTLNEVRQAVRGAYWPAPTPVAGLAVEEVFSTYIYEGTSANKTITNGIDIENEGGLVWIKTRTNAGNAHHLHDSERGVLQRLRSNGDNAEGTEANAITSFNADGFSLGSTGSVNGSTDTHASWTFRKAPKFFDVVTWTGENFGGGRQISHNLGSVPGTIIIKRTSATSAWYTWHRSTPNSYYTLDSTDAGTTNGTQYYFGDGSVVVAPTATEFTTQTMNENGFTYVAYLFAHNDGDGVFGPTGDQDIIKCGSYTGGSDTQDIDIGFEPQWIMIKNVDNPGNWNIYDNMRGFISSSSVDSVSLRPNTTDGESNATAARVGPRSNGFGFISEAGNDVNSTTGYTYIYIAIRRGPMKTPTNATEVFDAQYNVNGSDPMFTPSGNFAVDFATWHYLLQGFGASNETYFQSRLTGPEKIATYSNSAGTNDNVFWDYQAGWATDGVSEASGDMISHMFRRAPGFFDVVAYSGSGSAQTINHSLGVVPEMMIVKRRSDVEHWQVYHKDFATNEYQQITDQVPSIQNGEARWNNTRPTSAVFSVGSHASTNASGSLYVNYMFATLPNISKVGSYLGTGVTQTIDCGFSSGARFVLIKRTDAIGEWHMFDTERGIIEGNDPRLELNTTSPEDSGGDYVDPESTGFAVTGATEVNASGGNYIFLAIA